MAGYSQQAKAGFNRELESIWNKLVLEISMGHLYPHHPCLKDLALNYKVHLCASK